jgi:glutamate/aspartate transport system substrate-binding protein
LGHRDAAIPFSYLDENQKPIGYSLDICYKIVDHLRKIPGMPTLKIQYQLVNPANRIPLLANGTIDIECGSNTNTAERQKHVAYTPTIFVTAGKFVSKKSSNIKSLDNLRGKILVAVAGTTNLKWISELNREKNLGIDIIQAANHSEAFMMVETGRASAYINDDILLSGLIANSKNPNDFEISNDPLTIEPYGLMIRKDDPEFKKVVDSAVKHIFERNIFDIYNTWFNSSIPPKNINLKIPMSSSLKKSITRPTDSFNPLDY